MWRDDFLSKPLKSLCFAVLGCENRRVTSLMWRVYFWKCDGITSQMWRRHIASVTRYFHQITASHCKCDAMILIHFTSSHGRCDAGESACGAGEFWLRRFAASDFRISMTFDVAPEKASDEIRCWKKYPRNGVFSVVVLCIPFCLILWRPESKNVTGTGSEAGAIWRQHANLFNAWKQNSPNFSNEVQFRVVPAIASTKYVSG